MGKNRNSKKFRKKLNKKNQMNKHHNFQSTTDWFNKNFNKCFNQKNNQLLMKYMNENDESLTSKEKLEVFKKRNDLGNQIIDEILKNKVMIKRLMLFLLNHNQDTYSKMFQQFIYLPYNVVGNKHHEKFNEIYDFISEFSLGNLSPTTNLEEEISLFRVMDDEEYNNFLIGNGVVSPSFTKNPFYLQYMRGNNTYMDVNKKSIFVMFKFKMKDLIIDFQMSGEGEIVIKKGSIPTFIKKYSEYGIEDVKNDLGDGVVDYLPITTYELNNGFTYMDGLVEKGYEDLNKTYFKKNNQWFKNPNSNQNYSWINQYLKDIQKVVSENGTESHKHISQINDELDKVKSLGKKVLNNPFIDGGEELKKVS